MGSPYPISLNRSTKESKLGISWQRARATRPPGATMDSSSVPDWSTSAHQSYLSALRSRPVCWPSGSASSSCWLQWEPNSHLLGLHKPGDLPKLKGDEVSGHLAGQKQAAILYRTTFCSYLWTNCFSLRNVPPHCETLLPSRVLPSSSHQELLILSSII